MAEQRGRGESGDAAERLNGFDKLDSILQRVDEDGAAGRPTTFYAAAERAALEGEPLQDLNSRGGRRDYVTALVNDDERASESETAPANLDPDTRDGRVAYITGRMDGRIGDDDAPIVQSGAQASA
jgi:hypothetical protein